MRAARCENLGNIPRICQTSKPSTAMSLSWKDFDEIWRLSCHYDRALLCVDGVDLVELILAERKDGSEWNSPKGTEEEEKQDAFM